MSVEKIRIVVPWHNPVQRDAFLSAWGLTGVEPFLVLQQDATRAGCARTKNAGIERAVADGADIVIVLDDDCYPHDCSIMDFMARHRAALEPQDVRMFECVTEPPSRGTPYFERTIKLPVAASMGFWRHIGDYDAVGQLAHGASHPMVFHREPIHGRYFPLCGMNLAFRPRDWAPWWQFIDVSRFDDIWQGFLWQRHAYERGHCFNLGGPVVRHARQSNVWANLRDEAVHLEANETLWRKIATHPQSDYTSLRALLPVSEQPLILPAAP